MKAVGQNGIRIAPMQFCTELVTVDFIVISMHLRTERLK